jgi:hypothetical protein
MIVQLLPSRTPEQMRPILGRLAGRLSATTVEADIDSAPDEGFLLLWLGGRDGSNFEAPPSVATRLVLLCVDRSGLHSLAQRLQPAAMIEEFAFTQWEFGHLTVRGAASGLIGLRQAPLETAFSLRTGDYVVFAGTGEPVSDMLASYLAWRGEQAGSPS